MFPILPHSPLFMLCSSHQQTSCVPGIYSDVIKELLTYRVCVCVCVSSGMRDHPPITVCELADDIDKLKANENLRFSQQYEV